jgi:DNA-binding transcriptional ArsR family regulator
MARKKVTRSLPELPHPPRFASGDHKTDQILSILRHVAVETQLDHPQPFYSVRDVAAHFHVPQSTVGRIYRRLEQEGLLSRVRGSRTILQGLEFDRQLRVRAFVGLPASLSEFVTLQDYRMFFIRVRREMRLRGFATAMLLYEGDEVGTPAFAERLKAYEVDTVLWFQPRKKIQPAVLRLSDRGIRMIGVSEEASTVLPCRYQLRREQALRSLLGEWKTLKNLDKITLVQSRQHRSAQIEEMVEALLDELRIPYSVATLKDQPSGAFLRTLLKAERSGLIFPSSSLPSKLSFRAPGAMTELIKTHRVGLVGGPVNMPFAKLPDVRVDLITFDWQLIAERIVDDLATQQAFQDSGPVVFQAESQLQVPLNSIAQDI